MVLTRQQRMELRAESRVLLERLRAQRRAREWRDAAQSLHRLRQIAQLLEPQSAPAIR